MQHATDITSQTPIADDTGLRRALHPARLALEQSGQALVEFALVLPLFALALFAFTQFGLALNSANDQTHIANEVARYAIVNQNPGDKESLQAWGKNQADQAALKGGAKVCITFPPEEKPEIGGPVKVEMTSTVNWAPIPGLAEVFERSFKTTSTVTGTAYMRLEALPTTYVAGCAPPLK